MRGIISLVFLLVLFGVSLFFLVGIVLIPLYFFLVFVGSKRRAAKLSKTIDSILMPDESKLDQVMDYRIFALFHRRAAAAITDSRVIAIQRKIFGGYVMRDYQWKDLADARLEANILPGLLGTALSFDFMQDGKKGSIKLDGVNPKAASAIYGYSQTQEQAWEEKRRIRSLEEKRAVAGGVIFHGTPYAHPTPPSAAPVLVSGRTIEASATDGVVTEINKAKTLFESGAITDAEFQEIKSKILSRYFQ